MWSNVMWPNCNNLLQREVAFVIAERTTPEIVGLFEDILRQGAALRLQVTGHSMTPFLCHGEIVVIRAVPVHQIVSGDLLFFTTAAGQPLLHRLIRKRATPQGTLFQTKGDALRSLDHPFLVQNLLGKVCQIEKRPTDNRAGITLHLERPHWQGMNYLLAQSHHLKLIVWRVRRGVKRVVKRIG